MFGSQSFRGGVHPPHSKSQTEKLPIEAFPAPTRIVIPLSQHIGAPAKVVVKRGDEIKVGQILGEAGGFVSSPVFSSVSGTVKNVGKVPHPLGTPVIGVEIENDGKDETVQFQPLAKPWRDAAPGELIQAISAAGIVGMGGASFPTHVKLSPPTDKKIDLLIINGAECEPYLTADHRLMLEKTEQVLMGVAILKKILGAEKTIFGVETNKPDAISAVNTALAMPEFAGIEIHRLKPKYPQGGEKQLINAVSKRQVPSGGLPMDVGCVVQNVETAYAVWDAIINGRPVYERVVTVTGPTVKKPKNLLVRIGTPIKDILDACATDFEATDKIICGGPMMGLAQADPAVPVIKSTSGILCLDTTSAGVQEHDCISCGSCVKACPIHLVPSLLAKYTAKKKFKEADEWGVLDCMECGSCAFVCPARINLVHYMKLGKFHVQALRKAAQKAPK